MQEKAARHDADLARMEAEEAARRARRDTSARLARRRAIDAASGTTSEGSPLLIRQDSAREAEREVRHILRGGMARAGAYQKAGRGGAGARLVDAGSTLLSGISRALTIR
ncbi:MAG: hypothetical protein JSU82_04905 [Rhodospirillales bacterium]|nr:MAG: hypothetical protein JSU82_04905 [Rhodospirillales bacterium]